MVTGSTQRWTRLPSQHAGHLRNVDLFPVAEDGTRAESGSVALDPKTGGVRAIVGRVASDQDAGFRSYNYATQSARSPGSTIKPLVVL